MIDYQDLPYDKQRELDRKAYNKYYESCFYDDSEDEYATTFSTLKKPPLTFNSWWGTELHQKYLNIFLRKYKLEKINKKADI